MMRLTAALLVAGLLAAGCGQEGTAAGAPKAAPDGRDPGVAVAFLGDLASMVGETEMRSFDADEASLELADGALVLVSAGAFATPVDVQATVFELDIGASVGHSPWGAVYVVSTRDDVALGAPVVIEVPRPADTLNAMQFIGGEWRPVEVTGTTSGRIAIPHFSEVTTAVGEISTQEQVAPVDHGQADAEFFEACFITISGIYGGSVFGPYRELPDDVAQADYALQLAINVCTTALVRRASPSGVVVSTECVAGQIGDDVDLRAAIGKCVPSSTASTPQIADLPTDDVVVEEPDDVSDTISLAAIPDGTYPVKIDASALVGVVEQQVSFVVAEGRPTLSLLVVTKSGPGDCLLTDRRSWTNDVVDATDNRLILGGEHEYHFASEIENCGDSFTSDAESTTYTDATGSFVLTGTELAGSILGFPITIDLGAALK